MAKKVIDIDALGYNNQKLIALLQIQKETMPTASADNVGKIYQYVGNNTANFTKGYFYKCTNNSGTYSWVNINVQAGGSAGSSDVVEGYYNSADGKFYEEDTYTMEIIGASNTIYIDIATSTLYWYDGDSFDSISSPSIQYSTLPTASASLLGSVYQYTGVTNTNYTHNYFYECVEDTSTTPSTYSWIRTDVQTPISVATEENDGTVKPDNLTTFVNTTGVIRTKVWAGTLAKYAVVKDSLPNDTTIIITDYDGIPPDPVVINGVKIVSWANGTDQEIADMIAGADQGKINLYDFWDVGDTRIVPMSAITANPNGAFMYDIPAGNVKMTLTNKGYMNQSGIHFVVGQSSGSLRVARMNTTNTNVGSWKESAMRADLNSLYLNAFSSTFKGIFKPFTVTTAAATADGYDNQNVETTTDYLALFAEKEALGDLQGGRYSDGRLIPRSGTAAEANALSQMQYFSNDQKNLLHWSDSGNDQTWLWWLRSPVKDSHASFCIMVGAGRSFSNVAANPNGCGIVPFGCI